MGFSKLREWVGTVTGKGDRWGRNRVGRSEPTFLSASTFALPPSTCTARREAGQLCGQLLLCCEAGHLLAVVSLRPVPGGESAGRVRLKCLVLRPVCLLAFAMPTALLNILPPFILLCLPPVHSMCARIVPSNNSLQAARLSCWQLQHGPAETARAPVPFDSFPASFSCRVHDPGPWCRVNL